MNLDSISQTIDDALVRAGLSAKTGALKGVTATIERALAAAGLTQLRGRMPGAAPAFRPRPPPVRESATAADGPVSDGGQFLSLTHANRVASRDYKLYVPSGYRHEPMPVIVMLHGCKQDPDDFARGTRMNAMAERHGFLVAYPAQMARDNGARCWNWFERDQQGREGVEPSLIAGIVGDIGGSYAVDPSRVFVAGLSAGAAMAVILGATYPEVFAGVAAHSGLPVGAAHDVASAFAVMQGRAPASAGARAPVPAVPTIVFHGDADRTVVRSNGAAIVEQAIRGYEAAKVPLRESRLPLDGAQGVSQIRHLDAGGRCRVEEWVVQGGAHAWFGGSRDGSYTDPAGPDASAEMVRFFLGQKA